MDRAKLPAPCAKCAPFNGDWEETASGLRRCDCARGQALRLMAKKPAEDAEGAHAPMISAETAAQAARGLAALPNFPTWSPEAQTMIANELLALCHSAGEAFWLVERMLRLYDKWPGPREMRLVFCAKYRPLSGPDAAVLGWSSAIYTENLPSERPQPEEPVKMLPAGHNVSASPSLELAVAELAKAKRMPEPRELLRLNPAPAPVIPETRPVARRITQADIDGAVEEVRSSRARREIEGVASSAASTIARVASAEAAKESRA